MFGFRKPAPALPAVCAVIVAAGSARRMGGENKLLLPLGDRPVLAHTLGAFERCALVRDLVVVCREQDFADYRALAEDYGITKLRTLLRGGETRTASVRAGVHAAPEDAVLIAVHDGARPLVSEAVIRDAIETAAAHGAAAPIVPVKDSIKKVRAGKIIADVPRDTLGAVQTPQVFLRERLLAALAQAEQNGKEYTDDCAAVEALGQVVYASTGDYRNLKITTPEDIGIAHVLLAERDLE